MRRFGGKITLNQKNGDQSDSRFPQTLNISVRINMKYLEHNNFFFFFQSTTVTMKANQSHRV